MSATPVFIMGSGRSGTKMVTKLFAGVSHVEAHHEYVRDYYQRLASLYFMARDDDINDEIERIDYEHKRDVGEWLRKLYESVTYYSEARYFVDASNKTAWVADLLVSIFPTAKFVHLVRDGRKVVSSFFHKLPNVYADRYVRIQQEWLAKPALPMPPPPEDFWWPAPQQGQQFHEEFKTFDRFQRLCWYWVESNRCIAEAMESVDASRKMLVKLEDLAGDAAVLERFLAFFDVPYDKTFLDVMAKPVHVYTPIDFPLTDEQVEQFAAIGGPMMERFGYNMTSETYRVNY